MVEEIQRLQAKVERLKGELEQAETLAENFELLYKKQYKRATELEKRLSDTSLSFTKVIEFAFDEGELEFLQYWLEGDWDACREWAKEYELHPAIFYPENKSQGVMKERDLINNIEGQSKAELIKIIEIQQEHDEQTQKEVRELRAELERLDSHKDLIYVIDGWYQDFQNNDYGSANEWLRHIRDAYSKIFNEEFDGTSVLHERDIEQQAKSLEWALHNVAMDRITREAIERRIEQIKSQGE